MVEEYWKKKEYVSVIFDQLPYYIFWKNTRSIFIGCNKKFAEAAKLASTEDIIGKTDYDLPWGKHQSDLYRNDDKEIIDNKKSRTNIEELQTLPDGSEIVLLTSKVPLFDNQGEVIGVLGIYSDITERKRMEMKLKEAKETAEALNLIKTDFIRNMQHDIRTPISGIFGMTDILSKMIPDPEIKNNLQEVSQCAKELLDYCNDIIDFSNIEYGLHTLVNKPFSLQKILDQVITLERPIFKVKQLKVVTHYDEKIPPIILGDPYRTQRILINLISNAVKFTQKGGVTIEISEKSREKKNIVLEFKIQDTGIGIPEDKKDFIYEKLFRGNPSNKGIYKGKGLGLRVVKQFIEEMEGDIFVESTRTKALYLPFFYLLLFHWHVRLMSNLTYHSSR